MDEVRYEVSGSVAHIVLDRPRRANAIHRQTLPAIVEAARAAERDRDVAAIVLRGEGKGFSTGHDLSGTPAEDVLADVEGLTRSSQLLLALWEIEKPVIAQVHGYCLGAAVDLTLVCDLVIAAEDARFGHPAMRGAGGLPPMFAYPLLLGMRRTVEFLWMQEELSGREAVDWGLANVAVPSERLTETTAEWTRRLAAMPRENIVLSKRALHRAMEIIGFRAVAQTGVEFDAIGHWGAATRSWRAQVSEVGLAEAVRLRDEPFRPST
jgi:enoyl-CoA hydratase